MRTRTSWLGWLLTAGMALAPAAAWGQGPNYAPPDVQWPLPLFHDRPENGGFYLASEFMFMRQTNPLAHQEIAKRGLVDFDGSITAALNGRLVEPFPTPAPPANPPPFIFPGIPVPGNFIGSGAPALFADDAGGPGTYQPGFKLTAGWLFENGFALEVNWIHLFTAKYAGGATLVPPDFRPGFDLENTFLFAPVTNFPNEYAGPANKLALGNPGAAFGIWNAAESMTVQFTQRYEQFDITGRVPIYQNDNYRCYGLVGPQLNWIWERFRWRTVAEDFLGNATPADVALYNNIVSNRFYGVHLGTGHEVRLGDTPAGTFSLSVDLQAAMLLDIVKERAKYERGDFAIAAQRSRTEFTPAPELEANVNLWWYPIEGIQVRLGYDVMGFFNTVAAPSPVSFSYSGLDPPWERGFFRFFDGFNFGVGLIF